MKKILSVALSAVMLTGLISGCGGNETANKDGVTTVEIWSGDISAKQCWMELADEFNNGEGKETLLHRTTSCPIWLLLHSCRSLRW